MSANQQHQSTESSLCHCEKNCIKLLQHWSRIPERIAFRLAVLVFRCRNSTSKHLARDLQWTVDDDSGKSLRSASSHRLMVVRRSRLKTIGNHAFGLAAPRVWNGLPLDVISAVFIDLQKHLKTSIASVV